MNIREKIELQILSISNSHTQAGAYALLLGEKGGTRKLPIIIGTTEAQAIVMEIKGIIPPRPLTHGLFVAVLETLGARLLRSLIYRVDHGVFYACIYLRTDDIIYRIDSRTSDAIVLALRMNAPILIYEDILQAECVQIDAEYPEEARPTPQVFSLERLKTALQKAIQEEDYELAATLRDQINQHKPSK